MPMISPAPRPDPLAEEVLRWNRLRQPQTASFSELVSFLLTHREWPGSAAMRKAAEEKINIFSYVPAEMVRFFTAYPPTINRGRTVYALALLDVGRTAAAKEAARAAWAGGTLGVDEEGRLLARFTGLFTAQDHDRRIDKLLWQRNLVSAQRLLPLASAARRPHFEARIALLSNAPDALSRVTAIGEEAGHDAGIVNDRIRYYRASNDIEAAKLLVASSEKPYTAPADPGVFLQNLLELAQSAATQGDYARVAAIALRGDDAYAEDTTIRDRPLGERDDYTSLMWLGGRASERLYKFGDATGFYARYGDGARTAQTRAKGYYWAGRMAERQGGRQAAIAYYEAAARYYDHFHGQLALERLGRPLVLPVSAAVMNDPTLKGNRQVNPEMMEATRLLGQLGAWQTQSLFLRALANAVDDGADPAPLATLAREINRPDLGVMAARKVDDRGNGAYLDYGFPKLPVPFALRPQWTMIHAIARQESQFDRQITSSAGARGLMQLMPGTAREVATKTGVEFNFDRLTIDPEYNITLGATYFDRLLRLYDGNHVLAVAAYNAGPGNVRKFINANGDPRSGSLDILEWIEAIPFSETRGYVYRVLENAVIYDALHPDRQGEMPKAPLSRYLSKSTPG
jgi:soluble lytic murein transglycosylase